MDFAYSEKVNALRTQINDFMQRFIFPNEQTYRQQIAASGNPHHHAEMSMNLKEKPGQKGSEPLLPDAEYGAGLTTWNTLPWLNSWGASAGFGGL